MRQELKRHLAARLLARPFAAVELAVLRVCVVESVCVLHVFCGWNGVVLCARVGLVDDGKQRRCLIRRPVSL